MGLHSETLILVMEAALPFEPKEAADEGDPDRRALKERGPENDSLC